MRVWTTVIGQRLDGADNTRSMLLCAELLRRGHQVVMWTSAYDHIRKQWRTEWRETRGRGYRRADGLEIRFMRGCGYVRNLSLRRLLDHWLAARSFRSQANKMAAPDLIIASLPDHITAAAAVAFGNRNCAATIVDIRDKWPDIFVDHMPNSFTKGLARIALAFESRRARVALQNSTAIVAMMESMLNWGVEKSGRQRTWMERVFYLTTSPKNFDVRRDVLQQENAVAALIQSVRGRIVLAFVGTFNRTQHPNLILDALELLRARAPDIESRYIVVIAGDGMDAAAVKARANAIPNARFAGWLSADEIAEVLHNSHVGLLAMNVASPAFNNKSFAYLASGLPIINGATGDLAEIIEAENAGINVAGGSVPELAAAMERLIRDDALREAMTLNVRRLFHERFDRERNYRDYVDHVEKVAESVRKLRR